MSEVTNSIFGRSTYGAPPGGYVPASTAVETDTTESGTTDLPAAEVVDTKPVEAEKTETAESTDDATETTDVAETVSEDHKAESSTDADAESTDLNQADDVTEDAEDTVDETTDEDDESDVDEEEPAAETRPAAGARGNTTVADGVLAKVVDVTVRKTDGVHSLADEGISVEIDGDVATITVSLVVVFGHPVKALAEQIRVNVIDTVEPLLSLDVEVVDVHITDIYLPDEV